MTKIEAYPLLLDPALKQYVWGGRNLERLFYRRLPPGVVAESWEIAAHPDGTSVVANGLYRGMTLSELHDQMGLDLIGRNSVWAQELGRFPLLVKLLDAHRRLSVQVHPDDHYAQTYAGGELGKTEMWVVLHAEPGAEVILGLRKDTTPELFRRAIANGQLGRHLHRQKVKQGDFVCVPSGSVHAILGGLVLAEIQQNSNVTFRVYDWGRENADRPLHIEEALAVINFEQVEPPLPVANALPDLPGIRREQLCRNKYFTVERVAMKSDSAYEGICDGRTLEIWGVVAGNASISAQADMLSLPAVGFALLPAAMGAFRVEAKKETIALRIFVES